MYFPHETLPQKLKNYINNERLKIFYQNFDNILGVLINKNIYIKKKMHLYSQRFTIAHELGHYYFGDKNTISYFGYSFYEKRADNFAMVSLLPKNSLLEEGEKHNWDLTILEKVFGVEMKIIEKRLRQIFQN